MKKKLLALTLVLMLLLAGCGSAAPAEAPAPTPAEETAYLGLDNDIVILYTNDVHCGVDDNLGYAGLATVKNALEAQGKHVVLVDNGDAVQGDTIGTLSNGEYIIDIMNEVGYDVATPGNHEFDYGMDQFFALTEQANFPYVSANFVDNDGNTVLDPYVIKDVAGVKIAFVGISTPKTITTSTPKYFQDDNGNYIYAFQQDETGEKLYAAVQAAVDAARAEGAQFVIAMAHLGIEEDCSPWTSSEVIVNTTGIDAVLDGHSHSMIECEKVKNKDGAEVLLSSTETKLAYIGCLTIKDDGSMSTTLISDNGMKDFIGGIQEEFEELVNTVVASTDVDLIIKDPASGERIVRVSETNLGDLCADAYRAMSGADVAIVNGGGVRADIPAGDITYGQIIAVHPFGNEMCVVECTGQEILDALELGCSKLPAESGGFLHVSGMTYTIDLNVESTVKLDENGMFVEVEGERRVKDVTVGGEPLDPEKTYTLASHNYKLKDCGDGYSMFADNVFLQDSVMIDNQVLINYIVDVLGGTVGEEYADPYGQGRITIIEAN
ncbi:MAG: bifunctional UDP-sugar hydrolase/5'-nucleotidase [Candidatus Limivicinus sp.]|nr:bifunctional UDP-sugar hydrolase/5'-nucleotidase [Candidatus Limivicinus sp.]